MRKILIINEGFSSNLGDQAINASMLSVMRAIGFDPEFLYFSNPSLKEMPHYDYTKTTGNPSIKNNSALWRPLKRMLIPFVYAFKIKKHITAAIKGKNYEYVIIGGGQLINSSEKTAVNFFAIAIYWWTKLIKKYSDASIVMVAVGAAGSFKKREFSLYKKALQKINKIWVRDIFSQTTLLQKFGVESALIPDIAFYDKRNVDNNGYAKSTTALIGIYDYHELKNAFISNFETREQYYEFWFEKLKEYKQQDIAVKLFYTTQGDAIESLNFKAYVEKRSNTSIDVVPIHSLGDLENILQETTYVYSARMHALILALKYNCKVEIYPISQKLISFEDRYIKNTMPASAYSKEIEQILSTYFQEMSSGKTNFIK